MAITLASISEALRTEDVEGLIASGAPSDEYDSEARNILSVLTSLENNQLTESSIISILALEWAKSFNRSAQEIEQRMPAFTRIALDIARIANPHM